MENDNEGFITLHRKMLKNPISQKPHWAWLWVYLLMRANWQETTIIWNGQVKIIKRGSFVTGRNSIAKETRISASTIEDILKYLESQQQIRQEKTTKYRVITIVNYDHYQKSDKKTNNRATTERQQSDTDNNTNNNNNDNKERVHTPKEQTIAFFEGKSQYAEMLDLFAKDKDRGLIETEFKRFVLYWTEFNGAGTKQRWELQEVFDVKRRLFTWFSRIEKFTSKVNPRVVLS